MGAAYYKFSQSDAPCCSPLQWMPVAELPHVPTGFLGAPALKGEYRGYEQATVDLLSAASVRGLGSFLARPAWQLTPETIAFCAPGEATADFLGRRVCYCGPGRAASSAGEQYWSSSDMSWGSCELMRLKTE
jgi:hypothetical protein